MSEWVSVLAVFWVLWALDGLRVAPRRTFTVRGGAFRRWRARVSYSRLSLPGLLPAGWRMALADVPLALSPTGICNRAAGSAGRPAETSATVQAWRWEDVREIGVARGWIYINGAPFGADTGHVRPAEILRLARLVPALRQQKIEALIARWFRPAQLRRRVQVLERRTAIPAALNTLTLAGFVGLSVYVVGDVASRLPAAWSERLVEWLPWILLGLLMLHLTAVLIAWYTKRRLRAVAPEKRGAALFSALLLPPQALRLRALLGDGFFPAQHPLAAILAFGDRRSRAEFAFNAIADLRWPLGEPAALSSTEGEILTWFRSVVESHVRTELVKAGIALEALLAVPTPDSPASCSYCPRCGDQFVDQRQVCPNGVELRPLARR